MNQFYEILLAKRTEKGWNKSQMARALDISSQLYGQYEKSLDNGGKKPGADFFIKWKKVFGEDLTSIFETIFSREKSETDNLSLNDGGEGKEYRSKSASEIRVNEVRNSDGPATTSQLLETINLLVRQNDKLMQAHLSMSDANRILSEKIATIPVHESTEIPVAVESRFSDLLEVLAELGTGTRWKSKQEALATLSKLFHGKKKHVSREGIRDGAGK